MKKFLNEFKAFAMKGNVLDMAIGVIIATAFGKITSSLVSDIFMPIIGIITGGVNISGAFYALDGQSYASIEAAAEAGVATLNYGAFLQNIIDFILIALCVFVFIKVIGKFQHKPEPKPEKAPNVCPYCKSEIPDGATRCPHCTSELTSEAK